MTTYLYFKNLYNITLEANGQNYLKGHQRVFMHALWASTPLERYTGRQMDVYDTL